MEINKINQPSVEADFNANDPYATIGMPLPEGWEIVEGAFLRTEGFGIPVKKEGDRIIVDYNPYFYLKAFLKDNT